MVIWGDGSRANYNQRGGNGRITSCGGGFGGGVAGEFGRSRRLQGCCRGDSNSGGTESESESGNAAWSGCATWLDCLKKILLL